MFELVTGLPLRPPVGVSAPDGCIYLKPGVPREVKLTLRSAVDAPTRAKVRLASADRLREDQFSIACISKSLGRESGIECESVAGST